MIYTIQYCDKEEELKERVGYFEVNIDIEHGT